VTTAEAAPVGCSGEEKRRLGKFSEVSTKFNLTT